MKDWPLKKRVFYARLMHQYHADQQQAQQDAAGPAQPGAMADWGHDTSTPTPANLPDGVDPSAVPTPEGVTNPYASGQPQQPAGESAAHVDGERVTRRPDAEQDDAQPQQANYDLRNVHPAVRKHGSVVRVRGDPEDDAADQDADT